MPTNKKKIQCETIGCKKKSHRKTCNTCRSKAWRVSNPERSAYNNLRHHAKARSIFIDLTYEEFLEFCYKYDYIDKKGHGAECIAVDRIEVGQLPGYTKTNIQPLSTSNNSKKRWVEYNHQKRGFSVVEQTILPEPDDQPF